ncbi:MAG TPA: DUF2339 domain-containing protein [Thermoanaerobaculia bacterium]|nr:DUF2339 domain-containing protein [Thermoanaerobaculia bacterium]
MTMDAHGVPLEIERRLRALEVRLAALEGRDGSKTGSSPETSRMEPPPSTDRPLQQPVHWQPSETPPILSVPPQAVSQPAAAASSGAMSLETRIGAHWLNRVGIAAMIIGVAYFLKYAFDNEWIGPSARVAIGLAAGIATLVWAERFQSRGLFHFANSLRVIGVGVLYLSIWAASHSYALFGNSVAFAAMTLVTAGMMALALRDRSEFTAGLALAAGFLTPLLLSGGSNQIAILSHIALLDLAAMVLVARHPWVRMLIVAVFGTVVLYLRWFDAFHRSAPEMRTFGFITLFFVIFAAIPLLRRWYLEKKEDHSAILLLPFANALLYFLGVVAIFPDRETLLGGVAASLASLFLLLMFVLQRIHGRFDDRPTLLEGHTVSTAADSASLAAVHLALAVGFITVAIPFELGSWWITIGWLVEAGVLLGLSERYGRAVLRPLALLVLGLALFRLLFVDSFQPAHMIWNLRLLTHAVAVALLAAMATISGRKKELSAWKLSVIALNAVALIGLTREVAGIFDHAIEVRSAHFARDVTYSLLWMLYGGGLMVTGFLRRVALLRWLALWLIGVTIAKVFLYDLAVLDRGYRILSLLCLGALLMAISLAYQRKWLRVPDGGPPEAS